MYKDYIKKSQTLFSCGGLISGKVFGLFFLFFGGFGFFLWRGGVCWLFLVSSFKPKIYISTLRAQQRPLKLKQRDKSDFLFKNLVVDRELLWETDEKQRLQPSCVKQAVSVCYQTKWQAHRRASLYFCYALFYVSVKNHKV